MRELLSQILRIAELEAENFQIDRRLEELVVTCNSTSNYEYYAVDSGYLTQKLGHSDILIQYIVAVGRDVRRRFVITKAEKPHFTARLNEIKFAESLEGLVLVDGPLTPYVNSSRVVGVSKEPKLARYGPRITRPQIKEIFVKTAKRLGEAKTASILLAKYPPGTYLEPVEVDDFYGTYIRSDWVLYLETPRSFKPEELCSLFRKYPIKLRLAHHLAKINKEFLKTVKFFMSSILREEIRPRDLL